MFHNRSVPLSEHSKTELVTGIVWYFLLMAIVLGYIGWMLSQSVEFRGVGTLVLLAVAAFFGWMFSTGIWQFGKEIWRRRNCGPTGPTEPAPNSGEKKQLP
jgi:hypothetical protein